MLQTISEAHIWNTFQMVATGLSAACSKPKFESLRTPPEVKELSLPHKMSVNSITFVGKWKKHAILCT